MSQIPTSSAPVDENLRRRQRAREDALLWNIPRATRNEGGKKKKHQQQQQGEDERRAEERAHRANERTDDPVYTGSGLFEFTVPQETQIAVGETTVVTEDGFTYRTFEQLEVDHEQNQIPPQPTDAEIRSFEKALEQRIVSVAKNKTLKEQRAKQQQQQQAPPRERLRAYEQAYGADDRTIRRFIRRTPMNKIPRRVLINPFSVFLQSHVTSYIYHHPYVEELETVMRPIRNDTWRVLFDRQVVPEQLAQTRARFYSLHELTTMIEWSGARFYDSHETLNHSRLLTFRFLEMKPDDDHLTQTIQYLDPADFATAKSVEQFIESMLHFHVLLLQVGDLPPPASNTPADLSEDGKTISPQELARRQRQVDPRQRAKAFFVFASFYSLLSLA